MAEQRPESEDLKQFHADAEANVRTFRYGKPDSDGRRPKDLAWLVRRPLLHVLVQVVREGGENNLHYHTRSETSWIVLSGRAVFTGVEDKILAELGPMEGIHIPGGARYRFAKSGPDDLEILQIVAIENPAQGDAERINLETHKDWMTSETLQRY
jgi:mannose-6-phosphate isomerase-like protein (cupin superfamily)